MRIDIVTIFPAYVDPLRLSLVGKAIDRGDLDLRVHDLRDFTHDRHNTVDDTPYGGGPGMVMSPVPWGEALDSIAASGEGKPRLVVPTPSGRVFDQTAAAGLSSQPWLVFACGRYEGIDARVMHHYASRDDWSGVQEYSIGDYVLAGGEAAVLVMVEAAVRLIPGVLGNAESVRDDSFAPGAMQSLVEGPVFTKPPVWRDLEVPEVLLSGNHALIAQWRMEQAQLRTTAHRPDLRFSRDAGQME